MPRNCSQQPGGFSLVELLVVIAIIGLLLQLTLPAVMMGHEAARQTACRNNLKQIALGMQMHTDMHQHLPSGGWTYEWLGEPELGTGREQPGGWVFNILDFVEQGHLRAAGEGLAGEARAIALRDRVATPIEIFNCPSRRLSQDYPIRVVREYLSRDGMLPIRIEMGAKTDYAACVGSTESGSKVDYYGLGDWQAPRNLAEGTNPGFVWPSDESFRTVYGLDGPVFDGVVYGPSEVRYAQITDGLSNVYLVGEKYLPPDEYTTGAYPGDNEHMYTGFNNDNNRTAYFAARNDLHERDSDDPAQRYTFFGSIHPGTWNMAFCDGRVRSLSYEMSLEIHRRLGSRDDGQVASWSEQ